MNSYGISSVGKVRKNNEDAYFHQNYEIGHLKNLFIIADGMGGHSGGEIASKLAVDTVIHLAQDFQGEELMVIEFAVQSANLKIFDESIRDASLFGMGTTIDVVTMNEKGRIFIGHVGDGRVYVQENGYLRQLTKDHSYVQELIDSGSITQEEALTHPNRNQITRALGIEKRIDIDLFYYDIYPQSEYLLMCSDGLSNMVDNETISDILKLKIPVAEKVKRLEQEAMDRGGRDNISLIVIELEKAV